jgi:RNase H-like domain found in reverse transcriptase
VTIELLQAFLGLFNFNMWFVPSAARILQPSTDVLKGSRSGKAAVQLSAAMKTVFLPAHIAMAETVLLAHPASHQAVSGNRSIIFSCWSSSSAAEAQTGLAPIGFLSLQNLSAIKSQYSAFDCKLLAVYAAWLHFEYLLEGRKFHFTDHKSLVVAVGGMSNPKSDR